MEAVQRVFCVDKVPKERNVYTPKLRTLFAVCRHVGFYLHGLPCAQTSSFVRKLYSIVKTAVLVQNTSVVMELLCSVVAFV
jgi:hypothetical protein